MTMSRARERIDRKIRWCSRIQKKRMQKKFWYLRADDVWTVIGLSFIKLELSEAKDMIVQVSQTKKED